MMICLLIKRGKSSVNCSVSAAIICFSFAQDGLANVTSAALTRASGQPNFTWRSPLIANVRPVFCVTMRVAGPRSQFQSNRVSSTVISRVSVSRTPPIHFSERERIILLRRD